MERTLRNVFVLNVGSSGIKYALFAFPEERRIVEGSRERAGDEPLERAVRLAIEACTPHGIEAVGHRVVHGGDRFVAPTPVTEEALEGLRELCGLDPLHGPSEVAAMEAMRALLPGIPAVAVFDTAFHKTLPEVASTYALPAELAERHKLKRYGFHGTSYRFVSERLQSLAGNPSRTVICHLGSGASVCALQDGKSVDTSMGFTPLEGLAMGTRCGDLDPGLVLHLLRDSKMTVAELENTLNFESGMKGIAGESGDVRVLEKRSERGDARAELALAVFAYRVRKYIGAYAAVLGGLDALAFTGGIGENSPSIRARICAGLEFLGIELDEKRNAIARAPQAALLTPDDARAPVWMIPTDEALQIARETFALLSERP